MLTNVIIYILKKDGYHMKHIVNYKPKDFAELLGVSVKTLQRWDREGILVAKRTPTDSRYYTYDQYLEYKGIKNNGDKNSYLCITRILV